MERGCGEMWAPAYFTKFEDVVSSSMSAEPTLPSRPAQEDPPAREDHSCCPEPADETRARPIGVRPSARYFPEVETLRAVAILLVFFYHADGFFSPRHSGGQLVSLPIAFMRAGHAGVDL